MADYDNPFVDPETQNIFKDSSVQAATSSQPRIQSALNDFNPFADEPQRGYGTQGGGSVGGSTRQPAVLEPSMPAPVGGSSSGQGLSWDAEELRRRQEELDRKAAELARREEELNRASYVPDRRNNFPPLPASCPIQPCFFQDISIDIPVEFQKIVKRTYHLWIAYSGLLFINIFGCLIYFIASLNNGVKNLSGTTFGMSIFYAILFTPCSFVCWYRPIYKAFKDDSSVSFFLFFFIFFFQFCVCILQLIGIDGWGTVGIINSCKLISYGKVGTVVAGVLMLIIGSLFGLMAALIGIVLMQVHRIYSRTGASFAKAQEEFAHGVMSNRTIQRHAGDMAANAARSSFN